MPGCVFQIKRFCLISFEVGLDGLHGVVFFGVPRGRRGKNWSESLSEGLVLWPVLYEISLHEFVVEKKDWEVELAVFVDGDFNLLAFRNVRNLFAKSDFVSSELTIYGELLISFHGCESLNFGDDSVFFGQAFGMYGCHILQLGAVWTLLKTLPGKLETLLILFNEVP